MPLGIRRRGEIVLNAGNCIVRSWRRTDKQDLIRYADNQNVSRNLRDAFPYPYTSNDADYWLDYVRSRDPETNYAIEVDRHAVGGIGFTLMQDVYRRSAEIGYWLAEPYWGRGIVAEALKVVTLHAFANYDLARIHAGVFGWNAASMRVLEKAGYVREAVHKNAVFKCGRLTDEMVYVQLRETDK